MVIQFHFVSSSEKYLGILGFNICICVESKGTVRIRVLLNLLDCMDFKLSDVDIQKLKDLYTVNNFQAGGKAQVLARYREVLSSLHFNYEKNQWSIKADQINFADIVSQFST